VDGLIARTDGEAIVVSFDAEESAGRIVLYRSTQAITSSNDMLNAAVAAILEPKAGPYRDYPVPGIAYYYAAFPERELMGGTLRVQAGRNATTVSAVVAAGTYRIGLASSSPLSRAMPLPFLVIQKRMSEARPVIADDLTPQSRSLSAETEKAIALLQARYGTGASVTKPEIMLFPEDMASPGGGEEYALRLVVRNVLSKGRYEQAAEELALYLSLPRSPVNAAKARFYRAQALGFAGRFREAFFELLRAQDAFFLECVPWMDYVLWNLHADGA
ncbi:MAG TPA: hypothetical protein PLC54_08630, partial [Spirochaetales bacterium]|nr:hypothetical protein [Spirochaetales bacterium]